MRNQDDLGYSVKGAGDVNDDGVDDIIIGATEVDYGGANNVGEAYVIFGGSGIFNPQFDKATLDATNGFIIRGMVANRELGVAVSIARDINNDGLDDILIGDLTESITVIFGTASGFMSVYTKSDINGSNGIIIQSQETTAKFGEFISNAGDVNNDGVDDVMIGAPSVLLY